MFFFHQSGNDLGSNGIGGAGSAGAGLAGPESAGAEQIHGMKVVIELAAALCENLFFKEWGNWEQSPAGQ